MEHRSDKLVKMVIELDGVRHLLVEDGSKTVCNLCSLHDFCISKPNGYCFVPGYQDENTRFVLEKTDQELQHYRVWHGLEEKAVLSKFVLLYDPDGGYMSPPSRWPFDDFDGFVEAMNKKYGANYTMWAYIEDIVP